MVDVKVYHMSVIKNGFTPFANGGCQSLLKSGRMGSNPLLMVDVKVYHMSVNKYGLTPFANWWMSKSTKVSKNGLKPFANGGCQSLLKSARMGSNSLLMVDVKVY